MKLWEKHIGNTNYPGNFTIEDKGSLGTKLTYCDYSGKNRVYWVGFNGMNITGITAHVPEYVREAVVDYFNRISCHDKLLNEESELNDSDQYGMEDYSEDDINNVEDKTKDNDVLAGRIISDDELKCINKNESFGDKHVGLYLCNECHKVFNGPKADHLCKGGLIETIISEGEYSDTIIGTKDVYKVQCVINGKNTEMRVMAYDEYDAKRQVEKNNKGVKIIDVKKIKESKIKEDKIPGGLGDDMPDDQFDENQLEIGVRVEMEHTVDPDKAREIAKDHLMEDPEYYTKLLKMEKGECDGNKSGNSESDAVSEKFKNVMSYKESDMLTSDIGFEAVFDDGKVQVTIVSSNNDLGNSVCEFLMQKIEEDWDKYNNVTDELTNTVENDEIGESINNISNETPEEKKRREALISAAAKAVEAMGEDELEAYAEQIKKRTGK